MSTRSDDWTVEFFTDPYTELFPLPGPQQTEHEVDALTQLLPPSPARVLDLACGQGRHAVRLARRGYEVVGLDSSSSFLHAARLAARELGAAVEFVQGDMRNLTFDSEFDAVLSLCTAWGYFDDEQNQHILDGVAGALRPGGRLIIDLAQRDWLVSVFQPRDWVELHDGRFAVIDRHFDPIEGVNVVTHRWHTREGELHTRQHRLRLYTATELDHMLRRAGLVPTGWYGGFSLEPFTFRSHRMLAVASGS
jgi:SAM-dependent methyltransferase